MATTNTTLETKQGTEAMTDELAAGIAATDRDAQDDQGAVRYGEFVPEATRFADEVAAGERARKLYVGELVGHLRGQEQALGTDVTEASGGGCRRFPTSWK